MSIFKYVNQINFRRVILLLLSAGMFVAIAGFIIYRDGSRFHTAFYLLFLIPGLVCVAMDPDVLKKMLREPLGIIAVLFLGTIALSVLYPGVEVRPEIILVKIALILVSLFIISQFVSENTALFKKVLMLAVMAVALVAIFNMYEFYWVAQHPYSARMSGYYLVENPLFLAGTFGSFFIAAIYLVIEYRRNILMVLLMMSSGGALMLAVVATQCRSFFVAVLAALVLPYFRKGRVTILVLLSLALLVLVTAVYLNPALLERTEFPRFQIWKYSLELIGERPFYGWGSDYDPTITVTGLPLSDTHNILLTVWLKYGALSLVALLLLLGYASFLVMNNLKDETLRLGGALLLFGVTMLFFEGHDIIAKPNRMWMMVWVPLGIVMGAMHAQNNATGSGKVAT